MSEPGAPRAVVAGHGDFAEAMIGVVQKIAGRADAFVGVSNHGRDAAGIEAAIREALAATGATVVFTDLPAGSCTMAARKITRDLPAVAVVTGTSVPMLLEFALGATGDGEALTRVADRGCAFVLVFPARGGSGAH
jgi:PTS system N-acetylgalactosamine-specific IIA component